MRAVYYCRVSTDEENQLNALEDQIQETENCIASMNWKLIDKYVDEGRSGTSIKKRDEYRRLFEDISSNKFDVIVIKSQDRLMRNTKEWYLFIDALVSNNKKLYFYLDNKFYTPDDALITGIKAILAEEYSRDLSKKINNAHKNRQAKGISILITSSTWGYDKVNKEVVINDKESNVVKLIYDLCIQGYGSRSISKELSNRNIFSRTGKEFPEVTIRKIIRNPLFKGTAVMNKTHVDFNTKKTIRNPESEWIIHENAVPPIVTNDVWNNANKAMDVRSTEIHSKDFTNRRIGKNLGQYNLSSKIFCGECGSTYWRRYRRRYKNKEEIIVDWSCSEYVKRGRKTKVEKNYKKPTNIRIDTKDGGCDNIHIKEEDLLCLLGEIAKDVFSERKISIIKYAMDILNETLNGDDIEKDKKKLDKDKTKILYHKNLLLDKLLDGTITDNDYKRKDSDLENKLNAIIVKEKTFSEKEDLILNMNERLDDLKNDLNNTNIDLSEAQKLIKHIVKIVMFKDHMEIYFDFYKNISVNITGDHKSKKFLYVESGEYIIPHTDNYRNTNKMLGMNVSMYM